MRSRLSFEVNGERIKVVTWQTFEVLETSEVFTLDILN